MEIKPIKPEELYTLEEREMAAKILNLENARDSICNINIELNKRIEERDLRIKELETQTKPNWFIKFSEYMLRHHVWIRWLSTSVIIGSIVKIFF